MVDEQVMEEALTEQKYEHIPKMVFNYKNYKGKRGTRTVKPLFMYFGSTSYHPESQWLLRAYDFDRGAERDFAMKDITDIK